MTFEFDARASDSSLVETLWRTQSTHNSDGGGTFTSLAASHWEMVVTKMKGQTTLTVRGPETVASPAPIPVEAEFFGIIFKLGTFMPHLPVTMLVDNPVNLPDATSKSFYLNGSAWEFPTFDNADIFIHRLIRGGLLVHEPVVNDVLQGRLPKLSIRSVRRQFLRATGLTHGTVYQIERARLAASLLETGVSIQDTIDMAGYFDQPHLTRSLKRLIGQTPAQIIRTPPTAPVVPFIQDFNPLPGYYSSIDSGHQAAERRAK